MGYDAVAEDVTGVLHLVHVSYYPDGSDHHQVLWRCTGARTYLKYATISRDKPYTCLTCLALGE
jgi:hypothetical protein